MNSRKTICSVFTRYAQLRVRNHPGLDETIVDGCELPRRIKGEAYGDEREYLWCCSRVEQSQWS
jgi:hypothetical protein